MKEQKVAAFFDLDETVIRGASSWLFTLELYKEGFFGLADLGFAARHTFLYLLLGEDKARVEAIRDRALKVMAGHRQEEVLAIGERVSEYLMQHRIFPGTRKIIDRHLAYGHDVWIISAAPVELPRALAKRLGITGGIGTRVALKNGVFQARLAAPIMHGKGKSEMVKSLAKERGYRLESCFAYSDSLNDLPLLSLVGKPNAINPDFRLRWWATQRGWPIFDFRRARLRLRKPRRKLREELLKTFGC